jgi:hypothetical protein
MNSLFSSGYRRNLEPDASAWAIAISRASPKLTHGAELPTNHPVRAAVGVYGASFGGSRPQFL